MPKIGDKVRIKDTGDPDDGECGYIGEIIGDAKEHNGDDWIVRITDRSKALYPSHPTAEALMILLCGNDLTFPEEELEVLDV